MFVNDISDLFQIEIYKYTIHISNDIPKICRKEILMPMHDLNGTQYLYYIDLEKGYTILWKVDTSKFVSFFCTYLKKYEIPQKIMYGRINIHSLLKHENKIYALPDSANFIMCFDLITKDYSILCESYNHIYGLSNTIYGDAIYYTKWSIHDQLNRYLPEQNIKLEIGRYEIKKMHYHKITNIDGPDSIHQTVLTPGQEKIIALEVPRFSKRHNDNIMLVHSKILIIDVISNNLDVILMDKAPAHIIFDKNNLEIAYVACCNFSALGCFGYGRIDKYLLQNKMRRIASYEKDNLWRIPNHETFEYNNEPLLVTPVYPNQIHIINTDTMTIKKEIRLSASGIDPCTLNIPFYYPLYDSTPYTVLPINKTPYIILCSKWAIKILDFENNKIIDTIRYNLQNFPLWTTAHCSLV